MGERLASYGFIYTYMIYIHTWYIHMYTCCCDRSNYLSHHGGWWCSSLALCCWSWWTCFAPTLILFNFPCTPTHTHTHKINYFFFGSYIYIYSSFGVIRGTSCTSLSWTFRCYTRSKLEYIEYNIYYLLVNI